jgi:hypothetical protein
MFHGSRGTGEEEEKRRVTQAHAASQKPHGLWHDSDRGSLPQEEAVTKEPPQSSRAD